MQEGGEALVGDEGEKRGYDTCGEDPEAVAAGVACDEETFCLVRGDAAESDEREDGAAIISHHGLYRMRTRTRASWALTWRWVPGRLHRMPQKMAMTRQILVLAAIASATNARKMIGESRIIGTHKRKMGSHSFGQWKLGVSMATTAKLGVTSGPPVRG